jgi:hypothetical protein
MLANGRETLACIVLLFVLCGHCAPSDSPVVGQTARSIQYTMLHGPARKPDCLQILPAALGPGVYSASSRNEYQ